MHTRECYRLQFNELRHRRPIGWIAIEIVVEEPLYNNRISIKLITIKQALSYTYVLPYRWHCKFSLEGPIEFLRQFRNMTF
jgi:hypothetical protein